MINARSVQTVDAARFGAKFHKPLYDSYSFSRIPDTLHLLLTGENTGRTMPLDVLPSTGKRYDKVILLLLDAFGWRFFERYADKYLFLKRFITDGVVSKMSAQFPSTTSAHMTTIHTAKHVGATGVFEWYYLEPSLNRIVSPLVFSFLGDKERNTIMNAGMQPADLFPFESVYRSWATYGIEGHLFGNVAFHPSPYTEHIAKGAHLHPYENLIKGVSELAEHTPHGYSFFYFEFIDTIGHYRGVNHQEFHDMVDVVMNTMESILIPALKGTDTLLILTADHGQVEIDPQTTFYLNREIPDLIPMIRIGADGKPLIPAGSARDVFLYVNEGQVDAAYKLVSEAFGERGEVHRTADLIDQGFFGEPSDRLRERMADLVVLPYAGESVYWYEQGKYEQTFSGHHGGLTAEELHSVFAAVEL
jgi:hypothetical protein